MRHLWNIKDMKREEESLLKGTLSAAKEDVKPARRARLSRQARQARQGQQV